MLATERFVDVGTVLPQQHWVTAQVARSAPMSLFLPTARRPHLSRTSLPQPVRSIAMTEMKLQELKTKPPTELLSFAEEHGVENASTMRKQELMFAVLKQLAGKEIEITGTGVVEVLQDGFGF